jgi:putative nucleotidyltransferase with HDIG domain
MAGFNRVLFICDDSAITSYLGERLIIEGGYSVSFEASSATGLEALRGDGFDVVIFKFDMPGLSNEELVRGIKKIDPDAIIIAVLTEPTPEKLREASRLGIYDFVAKPMSLEKLFFLVRKGLELHSLLAANRKLSLSLNEQNTSLQKQNVLLAKRIEESTKNLTRLYEDLRTTYMRTIKALAQAIDARDHYTHSHSENVAKYAVAISEQMNLPVRDIETIREACQLHDLGKIGVVDSILSKPSSLTPEEWDEIKRHPLTGAQILEPLTFLNDVIDLVRQHHEHYDGSGYPEGRKGEDILLGARIINLADAYEAMRSARSYRKVPLSKEEAIYEIKKNNGKQFDPKVVEAFLKVVDKL